MVSERLLKLSDVTARWGCTKSFARARLKPIKLSRKVYRYRAADVEAFEQKRMLR